MEVQEHEAAAQGRGQRGRRGHPRQNPLKDIPALKLQKQEAKPGQPLTSLVVAYKEISPPHVIRSQDNLGDQTHGAVAPA